jgi:hypothetical protein
MPNNWVRERLSGAVDYLATMPGSLGERVFDAYRDYLAPLRCEDFEGEARQNFEMLRKSVEERIDQATRSPEPWNLELHGGRWEIAKRRIREKTAQKMAELICSIHRRIESE